MTDVRKGVEHALSAITPVFLVAQNVGYSSFGLV